MNERIQELMEQAGLKYYNWSTNESNVANGDFIYPRLEDYQKFAELIVRECAGQCLSDDCMRILNHFGVKHERKV